MTPKQTVALLIGLWLIGHWLDGRTYNRMAQLQAELWASQQLRTDVLSELFTLRKSIISREDLLGKREIELKQAEAVCLDLRNNIAILLSLVQSHEPSQP